MLVESPKAYLAVTNVHIHHPISRVPHFLSKQINWLTSSTTSRDAPADVSVCGHRLRYATDRVLYLLIFKSGLHVQYFFIQGDLRMPSLV